MAIMISSGSDSSRIRPSWSVPPSTFTPSKRRPSLSGSSSTKPTGFRFSSGLRTISRRVSRPPSPAPTITTRRALRLARKPRIGRSLIARARNRTPPVNRRVRRKKRASTPVGIVRFTRPSGETTVTGWTSATSPATVTVSTTTACSTPKKSRWVRKRHCFCSTRSRAKITTAATKTQMIVASSSRW
jgi:hypothetical protein